ncbi:oligogalacturonate-specific porin KdgM family protein [Celerinatantimonas yamalensis]|uniref:Oligogalacturonate-specific porin KdgM family protein n=1 Tax=Celerinatantimonas yamalensis TaxID=559956 RepID=A0ABW9G5I9_9GAMM
MKTYKLISAAVILGLFSASSFADTSTISYEHNYSTHNRFNTDNVFLDYQFSSGLYFGIGINLVNKNNDTFDDLVDYSEFFESKYNYQFNDKLTITPSLRLKYYVGGSYNFDYNSTTGDPESAGDVSDPGSIGARYIPGLAFNYKVAKNLSVLAGYQYELRKFSHREGKTRGDDRHRHVFNVGVDYNPNNQLELKYVYTYKNGDYVMSDNKKHDYEHLLEVSYRLNRDWKPYLKLADKAASVEKGTREAEITGGFSYYF